MPWQGPLTKRATEFRQNWQLYQPLNTYALTPRNIIMWTRKLLFYKRKVKQYTRYMNDLIKNPRFPMANKRRQILMHRSEVKFYLRIVSHYVRLLSGVPSDMRMQIAHQAADVGEYNQEAGIYSRSDHDVHQMLRTGNLTEGLNQVPYDILQEYMGRMRHERVLGRPWRAPGQWHPQGRRFRNEL